MANKCTSVVPVVPFAFSRAVLERWGLGNGACLVSVFGRGGQWPLLSPTVLQFLCPAQKNLCHLSHLCNHYMETWDLEMQLLRDQAVVPPEVLGVRLEEWAEVPEQSWCDPCVALLKEGESGQTPGFQSFYDFSSSPDGGEKTCSVDV